MRSRKQVQEGKPGRRSLRVQWDVDVQVLNQLDGQAYPRRVASERVVGPGYRAEGRTRRDARHCLFKYSLAGSGRVRNAQGDFAVPAGSGFLVEVGDPEVAYYFPDAQQEHWRFVFMAFFIDRAVVRSLIKNHGSPVFAVSRHHAVIRRLLAFRRHDQGTVDMTGADAMRLVTELIAVLLESSRAGKQDDLLMSRARARIEARLRVGIGVAELAAELAVSREHLGRLFRRTMGMSPVQYIGRRRMRLACQMLREEGLSVGATAAQLHFDTSSHFARSFRRHLGLAPQAYRLGQAAIPD